MAQYELWCFEMPDFTTYKWLGFGTNQSVLEDKCRELFRTRKYDHAMLCVVERLVVTRNDKNISDWKVVHPVIFNNNPKYWSKHPKKEDGVGFIWNSEDGDPTQKQFNELLRVQLRKNRIF